MTTSADPADLSPDRRAAELARLLAAGLLRLRPPAVSPPPSAPQNLPESTPNLLATARDNSVTVHAG